MTLSPVTGRRHTIFSVDIGVTDVTRNSRLFAVTLTTCCTLTQSVSVPIRHPSDKESFE